jgi:hypothetical protein
MTRNQIKAELRRSATEDLDPPRGLAQVAWLEQLSWYREDEWLMDGDETRIFLLLVAEAL